MKPVGRGRERLELKLRPTARFVTNEPRCNRLASECKYREEAFVELDKAFARGRLPPTKKTGRKPGEESFMQLLLSVSGLVRN